MLVEKHQPQPHNGENTNINAVIVQWLPQIVKSI